MAMFFQNMYAYNRLVLHSLLGALTLGTALSFFFTFLFYPALVKILFRGKKESVRVETAFSVNLLVSCLLGNLSHVLLDIFTHRSNPILWPFQTTTPSPIFTNQISIFIHIFCAALFLVILVNNRGNSVKTLLLDNANLSTTQ